VKINKIWPGEIEAFIQANKTKCAQWQQGYGVT